MNLVIDIQALQSPGSRDRGIGRYGRNLIGAIARVRRDWEITLVASEHLAPPAGGLPNVWAMRTFEPPLPIQPSNQQLNERYYGDWLRTLRPDCVLLLNLFDPLLLLPRLRDRSVRLVGVLYDLIPLSFPREYLSERQTAADYARSLRRLQTLDRILAISNTTARDYRTLLDERKASIEVIGGAADQFFGPSECGECSPMADEDCLSQFGLMRDFILYVGGFDHRKNLAGALEAFATLPNRVRRNLDFVLTCALDAEQAHTVRALARRLGMQKQLRLTGAISDHTLRALYRSCRLFFFPSLYEGLGIPILEALQCGAPVVASDRGAMAEHAGAASWLVDPTCTQKMAQALLDALDEPRGTRREERLAHARRFRWDDVGERACRSLVMPKQAPCAPRLPRLAWISPLPPTPSGIADYSAELLPRLAAHYDIELVVDPAEPPPDEALVRSHVVLSAEEMAPRHEARPFDHFVYQLGNSHYHTYLLPLLARFPGLIVLHDYYLGAAVVPLTRMGAWPRSLEEELCAEGYCKLARQVHAGEMTEAEVIAQAPLNRRLLNAGLGVAVHSGWSWKRLRPSLTVPVFHIPQAVSLPALSSPGEERVRLGLSAKDFLIVSLGYAGPATRLASLVQSIAVLPSELRQRTRLIVVGSAPAGMRRDLEHRAWTLRLGGQVHFAGRVPLRDFVGYARAADVCVQLRFPTRGETSAALLRALAAGAACVVSDHGPSAELPSSVVSKVRCGEWEISDLARALRRFAEEEGFRQRLGQAASQYIEIHHRGAVQAARYRAVLHLLGAVRRGSEAGWLDEACAALADCADGAAARACIDSWAALHIEANRTLGLGSDPGV